jgi:uncharacterized protein YciI
MKYFIIEIIYIVPLEEIEKTTLEHRAFLRTLYDRNLILMSGPKVPRNGGIVVTRADSIEQAEILFKDDPYKKKGLADYRFIEFRPLNHQEFIKDWIDLEKG